MLFKLKQHEGTIPEHTLPLLVPNRGGELAEAVVVRMLGEKVE